MPFNLETNNLERLVDIVKCAVSVSSDMNVI